jgi:hypothetical protein
VNDELPLFGDEVKDGESMASDGHRSVRIGRLYPFPVYVVRADGRTVSQTRLFFGVNRAIAWANAVWEEMA